MKYLKKFESIQGRRLSFKDKIEKLTNDYLSFLRDENIEVSTVLDNGRIKINVFDKINIKNSNELVAKVIYWDDIKDYIIPFCTVLKDDGYNFKISLYQLDSDFDSKYPYKDYRPCEYTSKDIIDDNVDVAAIKSLSIIFTTKV